MNTEARERVKRSWVNVPIIATVTRLLCRELTLQNEYLRQENKILRSKIKKRIVLLMQSGGHWLMLRWPLAKI
jgi:hypothetical protein